MEKFRIKKNIIYDRKTGKEIWEIGNQSNFDCVANYFYNQSFSHDEKYFIFSSNRTGNIELYRMELESDEVVQITENFNHWYGWVVYNDQVICNDGERIFAINIYDLTVREISRKTKDGEICGTPVISGNGKNICCLYREQEKWSVVISEIDGSKLIDAYEFPSEFEQISHLQSVPGEKLLLSFAPLPDHQNNFDLPPSKRARTWILDIETQVARPFLIMPEGYRATHEYWYNGNNCRLYFHKKTVPHWTPASICSIDLNGDDFKQHFYSESRKLGHSFIYKNFIVSDVQQPGENELYLINIETGKSEIICCPDSSCSPERNQLGHVHPSFSTKGNYIIYSSDKNGKTHIYIVPLKTIIRTLQ